MTLEEIKELILNLEKTEELDWTFGGKIRYSTEINGEIIVIDRRNNADTETSECYIKKGKIETIFNDGSDEYKLLSEFLLGLHNPEDNI